MHERLPIGQSPSSSRISAKLTPGAQLGAFEIIAPLGGGGMGDVYRARDSRLGREVALKIISEKLSGSPDGQPRFAQEARSASALNHPNIVTIFEFGRVDGIDFIAMELIEGETLRQLLTSGMVPLRKIIDIAAQMAGGLAKAHEAGIVHRDLKPANVLVSKDGLVKILDFGLAKPITVKETPDETTSADFHTTSGVIVGTAAYMSPEQASGKPVDFRSDQFSFGAVLYEAVTGRRAFQRDTQPETLVAVIREEPEPISLLNPKAHAPLCWIIERCLAKDPDRRYESTRDLARDLLAMRERLSEVAPKALERPSNLPIQRTPTVGRENEVMAVRALLARRETQLITLTGPGGIGKTRLGLQVLEGLAADFPGGMFYIPLAPVNDPNLVASVILQTLGVRDSGGQKPLHLLQEHLQNSANVLLMLDNFEHLLSAAPSLAELLSAGPGLKALVTSQARLHIYGEHEFPVPPLGLPDRNAVFSFEELAQQPAIALFVERARAVRPDFRLTAENASIVADICARLDGLPLAIELAAARIKLLSPASLLARFESRLKLLTGGAADLPARQRTLRGTIDWSYGLLAPEEQKLFRRLAVFAGGCTLESAEAVCNAKSDLDLDVLDGISSMVDKSLLQQSGPAAGESRFVMLETIREYALEHLAASGEEHLTRRAHAAYCLVLAEEETLGGSDSEQAQRLDHFEQEHDNFRAALEWLTGASEGLWGLRLGAALFRFWETREHLTEGRDRLTKLLTLPSSQARTKERVRALFAASVLAQEHGDYEAARVFGGESLAIARELHDDRGMAVSLNSLAVIARDSGDVETARRLFEQSLEVWRGVEDGAAIARALSNLANAVKLQGDLERARSLYQECLAIFEKSGDVLGVAWSLNHQGDVVRDQGKTTEAAALYEKALDHFVRLGDRWGIAATLADLGTLARDRRDQESAHRFYCESIRTFQELGHKRGIARVLESIASAAAMQGRPERALRLAGAAAALRQTMGVSIAESEKYRLEQVLESARRSLSDAQGTTAWMDGWVMPLDKVIAVALASESSPEI